VPKYARKATFVIAVLTFAIACGGSQYDDIRGQTMGTYFAVQVAPTDDCQVQRVDLERLLQEINEAMSTYQADSELSLLNSNPSPEPITVSSSLDEVLLAAREMWRISAGAFDVTVGPLVNLWGFGATQVVGAPTAAEQHAASARVGMDKLVLGNGQVTKLTPDVYVDLSALAKGYGVDRLAALLDVLGCRDYMVDIGGEIRVAGHNPNGKAWRVGVEAPSLQQVGTIRTVLEISDVAIATSGDYRNYRVIDGARVDHIIDPRTRAPATSNVISATVIHPSAMWADAYATTLMVLDAQTALSFADAESIAAYVIYGEYSPDGAEDKTQAVYNTAMRAYLPELSKEPL